MFVVDLVLTDQAAAWTYSFFQSENVQPAAQLSNSPKMYIGETGVFFSLLFPILTESHDL
jgi:hypothetical protein